MSEATDYVRGPGLKAPSRAPKGSAPDHPPIGCPWPTECRCTHTDGCVAGWIDSDEEVQEVNEKGRPRTRDGRPVTNAATRPCPRCRPEAARILADPMLTRPQQIAKIRQRKER